MSSVVWKLPNLHPIDPQKVKKILYAKRTQVRERVTSRKSWNQIQEDLKWKQIIRGIEEDVAKKRGKKLNKFKFDFNISVSESDSSEEQPEESDDEQVVVNEPEVLEKENVMIMTSTPALSGSKRKSSGAAAANRSGSVNTSMTAFKAKNDVMESNMKVTPIFGRNTSKRPMNTSTSSATSRASLRSSCTQRKSIIPAHVERSIMEASPYASPLSPPAASMMKSRKSMIRNITNSNKRIMSNTFFKSFNEMTTQTSTPSDSSASKSGNTTVLENMRKQSLVHNKTVQEMATQTFDQETFLAPNKSSAHVDYMQFEDILEGQNHEINDNILNEEQEEDQRTFSEDEAHDEDEEEENNDNTHEQQEEDQRTSSEDEALDVEDEEENHNILNEEQEEDEGTSEDEAHDVEDEEEGNNDSTHEQQEEDERTSSEDEALDVDDEVENNDNTHEQQVDDEITSSESEAHDEEEEEEEEEEKEEESNDSIHEEQGEDGGTSSENEALDVEDEMENNDTHDKQREENGNEIDLNNNEFDEEPLNGDDDNNYDKEQEENEMISCEETTAEEGESVRTPDSEVTETPQRKRKPYGRKVPRVELTFCEKTPSIIRPQPDESEVGLRRSQRTRAPRLEYWRGQRLKYQRDSTGITDKIIGLEKGSAEVKRKVTQKQRKKRKRVICHNDDSESESETQSYKKNKRQNILDLSIHDAQMRRLYKDNDNFRNNCSNPKLIHFVDEFQWKQAESGPDVHVVTIEKNKQIGVSVGIFKLAPKGQKKKQTTSDYVTHFTVISGAVSIQIENDPEVILKTASYFKVPELTQYMVKNLRKDEAFIAFTMTRETKKKK